jgi:hypothetical protein
MRLGQLDRAVAQARSRDPRRLTPDTRDKLAPAADLARNAAESKQLAAAAAVVAAAGPAAAAAAAAR